MLKNFYSSLLALIVATSGSFAQSVQFNGTDNIRRTVSIVKKSDTYNAPEHDHSGHAQEKCAQHSYTDALMANDEAYRLGVISAKEQTERIMAELESGVRSAPPVYTVPIVFHVIHKGEAVGSGTNISDAQIQSTIDALNRDYRRLSTDGGIALGNGPDTEIQFCLASVDPNGNPTSGINRVNGTSVSGYSLSGITSNNETSVKALSRWDNRYYLNIWVVSEIDGNGADVSNVNNFSGGTLGYAYLPTNPVTANSQRDGIVALNLCIGNDPNGSNGYRLWPVTTTNRVLTHEIGHFLGLNHTFSDSNPFSCANGDGISDTPNAQQVNMFNCNYNGSCTGQQIENYMDYTPEQCQDQFTNGQNNVMRGVLAGTRNALVNTNNCSVSSNDYDAGIAAILQPTGNLCDVTFTPQVTLTNYGSTTLTSVQISYSIDAQTQPPYSWSGNLASSSSVTVNLPSVTTTTGAHSFSASTVSGTLNGSNNDEDTSNDDATANFNAGGSGTQVTLTLELDCWGSETEWEIRNSSNSVVASGGPYTNSLPSGAGTITESFCLAEGCYDFTITDTEGDGLEGTLYPQSCSVDGDFSIVDGNTTLVQMGQPNFGSSFTDNFCIGGGSNPGTTCDLLLSQYGEGFFVNPTDLPSFDAQAIDNDQEPVFQALADAGYTSNWMAGFYDEVAPGDTNWFFGVTSYHADPNAVADNWLTFGPVTMLDDDGEIRWKHLIPDNDYRDGYRVLVGTSGTDVADFNSATVLFSVADNDPSTNGDTIWTQQAVTLPAGTYANQSLYFAIHHNASDEFLLFIDDIEVEGCTSLTVGLNDPERVSVNVYPNPSNGDFTFVYSSLAEEELQFELMNNLGQIVWSESRNGKSGKEVIDTGRLGSGVYTFVVRTDKYVKSEKLILTK